MKLTTNHPDPKISAKITDFLLRESDVQGDEDHLVNEPLSDVIGKATWNKLEIELELIYGETVDLPENLMLIEQEDVFETMGNMFRPEPPRKDNPLQNFVNKLNNSF